MPSRPKWVQVTDELHDYLVAHGTPPDGLQRELIAETATLPQAQMQLAPEQGALLTWLVRLIGARSAVEVGTFTGYSSLAIARGLPADGHLLCCDVSEEWTQVARRYWERAGVADRIELRIAPAADTLHSLPDEQTLDFALIDADKQGYVTYFDEVVRRLRPGGVVCVDNVLWGGRVVDADNTEESTEAIRAFNDAVAADGRVEAVMLPVGDGMTLARRLT